MKWIHRVRQLLGFPEEALGHVPPDAWAAAHNRDGEVRVRFLAARRRGWRGIACRVVVTGAMKEKAEGLVHAPCPKDPFVDMRFTPNLFPCGTQVQCAAVAASGHITGDLIHWRKA